MCADYETLGEYANLSRAHQKGKDQRRQHVQYWLLMYEGLEGVHLAVVQSECRAKHALRTLVKCH